MVVGEGKANALDLPQRFSLVVELVGYFEVADQSVLAMD